jgi:thiosulfate reductase cytochrome b subunit
MRALEPHSPLVRVTHWANAVCFAALLVSGVAVLLVHPRLYWGEAGTFGSPSLVDLPLPLVNAGQNGWGRSLHFLSAWAYVLVGAIYVIAGLRSGHLRRELLSPGGAHAYSPLQRQAYLAVVAVLAPFMIWTGLAMSPAVTSAAPLLVTVIGGQQSARTLHFVAACLLVLFVAGHVTMVAVSGFRVRMRGMITGRRGLSAGRA